MLLRLVPLRMRLQVIAPVEPLPTHTALVRLLPAVNHPVLLQRGHIKESLLADLTDMVPLPLHMIPFHVRLQRPLQRVTSRRIAQVALILEFGRVVDEAVLDEVLGKDKCCVAFVALVRSAAGVPQPVLLEVGLVLQELSANVAFNRFRCCC